MYDKARLKSLSSTQDDPDQEGHEGGWEGDGNQQEQGIRITVIANSTPRISSCYHHHHHHPSSSSSLDRLMKLIRHHGSTIQLVIITTILSISLLIYSIPSPHPQTYSSPLSIFSGSSDQTLSSTTTTSTTTDTKISKTPDHHSTTPDTVPGSQLGSNDSQRPDDDHRSPESRILDAAPILGFYDRSSEGPLASWMAALPDHLPITRLSIPGTHDSATWNYTQPTQDSLERVTGDLPPAIAYQCQDRSLFQMLGDGIRFFDLRVGFLPGHHHLGFFHAAAILSQTATLSDVLLGFYQWLDDHPTETVLVSIKVDNATFNDPPSTGQPSSRELQQILYELLTQSDLAQKHWLQEDLVLGTLGGARGKMIFIQRIEWDEIRSDPDLQPIGIPLPPSKFNDNDAQFEIEYNSELGSKVFIEDLYQLISGSSSVESKVELKLDAVDRHLQLASNRSDAETSTQLFLTFASGGALRNHPPVTPKMLAVGTGLGSSLENAVNSRIKRSIAEGRYDDLDGRRGRLGIVILDWYFQVPDLIHTIVDQNSDLLLNPAQAS